MKLNKSQAWEIIAKRYYSGIAHHIYNEIESLYGERKIDDNNRKKMFYTLFDYTGKNDYNSNKFLNTDDNMVKGDFCTLLSHITEEHHD